MDISLHRIPQWGTWSGAHFTRDFERQMEGSGTGISLSMEAL